MKEGLLLIAHGSKDADTNRILSKFMVSACAKFNHKFKFTGWCFLETEPSIPSAVEAMEKEGITRCLVIPLFVADSTHYKNDIPGILSRSSGETLEFDIAGPFMHSRHLKDSLLEQARILSQYPGEEGIILFAHGSALYGQVWNTMMAGIGSHLSLNTGIQVFNYAYIKNGKLLPTIGKSLIDQEMQSVNKLIILGMYFGKSVLDIYYKYKSELPKYFDNYRNDGRLAFSKYSLLSGDYIYAWISDIIGDHFPFQDR